jgi:hypothetical protein
MRLVNGAMNFGGGSLPVRDYQQSTNTIHRIEQQQPQQQPLNPNNTTHMYLDILQKQYSPIRSPVQQQQQQKKSSPLKPDTQQQHQQQQQHTRRALSPSSKKKQKQHHQKQHIPDSSSSNSNTTQETLNSVSLILNRLKSFDQQNQKEIHPQSRNRLTQSHNNFSKNNRSAENAPPKYTSLYVEEENARLKRELTNLNNELAEKFNIPKKDVSPEKQRPTLITSHMYDDTRLLKDSRLLQQTLTLKHLNDRNDRVHAVLHRHKERKDVAKREEREMDLHLNNTPPKELLNKYNIVEHTSNNTSHNSSGGSDTALNVNRNTPPTRRDSPPRARKQISPDKDSQIVTASSAIAAARLLRDQKKAAKLQENLQPQVMIPEDPLQYVPLAHRSPPPPLRFDGMYNILILLLLLFINCVIRTVE